MSDERRKKNKQSTGTVPKIKLPNTTSGCNDADRSRCVTNNLATYWQHPSDISPFVRNSRRNQRSNYFMMDTTFEEPCLPPVQNGSINFSSNANSASPNTSSSTSRRNSSVSTLKCDNVTKYPDKKQIEDKLHQIQEYLKITNSLMTSMKNTDEQTSDQSERESLEKMVSDLKDSEKKLTDILDQMNFVEDEEIDNYQVEKNGTDEFLEHASSSCHKNEPEINLDNPNQELDILKEQQLALMQLQQKAENKLKEARKIQSNLFMSQYENDLNSTTSSKAKESINYSDFDAAIKELEERSKRLRQPQMPNQMQENILAKVESLHNQIMTMHNANDEREQLIDTLDCRDAELRTQHAELQSKLFELQNKKLQVDQLVAQLHTFGEEEDDDVGGQVRKIVTMREQLKKLKDMLETVKTTEDILQNTNASPEAQAIASDIWTTAENYLEKDIHKPKLNTRVHNDSNVLRYDNDTSNEGGLKQVNKNTRDHSIRGVKPKSSISQKLALQSELESKKRELEEIMGKYKASTSNLNHDVGNDSKSEFSCTSNTINEAWIPLIPVQHPLTDSDRFSSDECQDDIEYTELHRSHNQDSPTLNFSTTNSTNRSSEHRPRPEYIQPPEYDSARGSSRTPERNTRSSSANASGYVREQPRSNDKEDNKTQVQKQLHLIKSVCDSMLEQQSTTPYSQPSANVQQLRNNLTPSPLHSEPRRFASPHPHILNALNVVNPAADVPWLPVTNNNSNLNNDMNNYQGWLTTNSIQTQSFMLNTLNQCCQMLWMQQRELVSLRNSVSMLQERIETNQCRGTQDHLTSSIQTAPQDQRSSNHFRPSSNQKVNHVSAAFSLPNLNQYNAPSLNMDPNYINANNVPRCRLLDPCLNNVNVNHLNATESVEHANNVLHGVNANINHALPNQMWNGQALNNQVAPGNRANNYWDNFRSYSRQNLLSTKNSEVLQNHLSSVDRSTAVNERTNPFSLMTFSKSNSEQGSTSTSQENTPHRRGVCRHDNINNAVIPPPDVLNVNHNVTKTEQLDLPSNVGHQENNEDISLGFQMLLHLNAYNDTASNHSNVSEEQTFKEPIPEQSRRRNEWHDEISEEQLPKSKLFDELRENVYKEVASLISANEARPHFLIQLFRDLQMIGSDSLRLKVLQYIQMVITHSLMPSQNSNKISLEAQQASSDQDVLQLPENFSLQSTVWSKPVKNASNISRNNEYFKHHNIFKGALPFLNSHEEDIIQTPLLISLKQLLLGSPSFKEAVKDTIFQKHFSNILDDVFEQYRGKKVRDIKAHMIQTLNDLLCGELGLIEFIQDTNPENCISHPSGNMDQSSSNFTQDASYEHHKSTSISQVVDNIQNGDLAEADQTRNVVEHNDLNEDVEEEGAVGGILNLAQNHCDNMNLASNSNACEDINLTCPSEGLDQVPTRLPTKVKSRSATPSRDRSNSHTDPDPF